MSVDASSILDNLAFAFMINGEARKGRWFVATDVIYLDLSSADSTVRSVDLNPGPGASTSRPASSTRGPTPISRAGCGRWWAATPRSRTRGGAWT